MCRTRDMLVGIGVCAVGALVVVSLAWAFGYPVQAGTYPWNFTSTVIGWFLGKGLSAANAHAPYT